MAFVCEYVSEEDFNKYFVVEKVPYIFSKWHKNHESWVVDRDRNIFLVRYFEGREEQAGITGWILYWGGEYARFGIKMLSPFLQDSGDVCVTKEIISELLPLSMSSHRSDVIDALKCALECYKNFGVISKANSYSLTLW